LIDDLHWLNSCVQLILSKMEHWFFQDLNLAMAQGQYSLIGWDVLGQRTPSLIVTGLLGWASTPVTTHRMPVSTALVRF